MPDYPHKLALNVTKLDDGAYTAGCACGEKVWASNKDGVYAQLATHMVETLGGIRDLLKEQSR